MKLSRGAQSDFSIPLFCMKGRGGGSIQQQRVHGETRKCVKVTFLHALVNKSGLHSSDEINPVYSALISDG